MVIKYNEKIKADNRTMDAFIKQIELSSNTNVTAPKVFLGGTCNNSTWRDKLIPMLNIDYFNPVVDDWDERAQINEIYHREHSDYVLYTITSEMKGVYSIAEAVDDSNKRPERTVFCLLADGFDKAELKSLEAVMEMIKGNGGKVFTDLKSLAAYLNIK